jgi:hypothetical protein
VHIAVYLDERLSFYAEKTMRRGLWTAIVILLFVASSAGEIYLERRLKGLEAQLNDVKTKQADAQWDAYSTSIMSATDFILPDVGTIQFLRRGYSISLEGVNYTQDGLNLLGQIGNGTNVTVSNLTLVFTARPYFTDEIRKKWEKLPSSPGFAWWSSEWDIGSGQTTVIPILLPRTHFSFSVTIPNVKQTKENIHIAVWFSGERYTY